MQIESERVVIFQLDGTGFDTKRLFSQGDGLTQSSVTQDDLNTLLSDKNRSLQSLISRWIDRFSGQTLLLNMQYNNQIYPLNLPFQLAMLKNILDQIANFSVSQFSLESAVSLDQLESLKDEIKAKRILIQNLLFDQLIRLNLHQSQSLDYLYQENEDAFVIKDFLVEGYNITLFETVRDQNHKIVEVHSGAKKKQQELDSQLAIMGQECEEAFLTLEEYQRFGYDSNSRSVQNLSSRFRNSWASMIEKIKEIKKF